MPGLRLRNFRKIRSINKGSGMLNTAFAKFRESIARKSIFILSFSLPSQFMAYRYPSYIPLGKCSFWVFEQFLTVSLLISHSTILLTIQGIGVIKRIDMIANAQNTNRLCLVISPMKLQHGVDKHDMRFRNPEINPACVTDNPVETKKIFKNDLKQPFEAIKKKYVTFAATVFLSKAAIEILKIASLFFEIYSKLPQILFNLLHSVCYCKLSFAFALS